MLVSFVLFLPLNTSMNRTERLRALSNCAPRTARPVGYKPLVARVLAAALLTLPAFLGAAPIEIVGWSNVQQDLYENVGRHTKTTIDDIYTSPRGFRFAERFVGQTLTSTGGRYDVLGNTATPPLTLQPGASGQNLYDDGGISGISLIGPTVNGIGEGSVAVLFPFPAREVAVRIGGSQPMTYRFFDVFGNLIDEILDLEATGRAGLREFGHVGFRRDGGVADIAGFSAEVHTSAGFSIDELVIAGESSGDGSPPPDTREIPLVPTAFLFPYGLVALVWLTRQRRSSQSRC